MNSQVEVPDWVKQGRSLYESESGKKNDPILYTNITRGQTAADVIERDIAPSWPKDRTFSICVVGPGVDTSCAIHQSYEPYVIAARLEASKMLYTMTIVDRNSRPLEDIKKRRTIFYLQSEGPHEESLEYWRRYLQDTGQKEDKITYEHINELEFRSPMGYINNILLPTVSEYLARGVCFAHSPAVFTAQLDKNNVKFVNGDVVTLEPQKFESPDLLTCSNVLMYMAFKETQQAALWNMSRAIGSGQHLLLNDFEKGETKSILAERGGWLTENMLRTFSLTMRTVYESKDYYYKDLLLTKV